MDEEVNLPEVSVQPEPTPPAPPQSPITRPPAPPAPKPIPVPPPVPRVVPVSRASWENDLESSSASAGVDAVLMRKLVGPESGGNPNAKAATSSAYGLFQITTGTWNGLAARYPQLGLTNRADPNQQARIAPFYMKEINSNLHRKLGREPDHAESYLGWFLGPVGAARALGADPSTPIATVVDPAALQANRPVFNKVSTVGDLYAWAARKMAQSGERAAFVVDNSSAAQKYAKMGVAVDPTGTSRVPFSGADDALASRKREEQAYSLAQAAAASVSQDWTTSWLLSSQGKQPFDPNFSVTPELLQRDAKGLPDNYLPYLSKASSQQDFEFRLRQSEKDHEVEQRLAATPYGLGVRMAVSLADPAGIALGILSPVGLAAKFAQVGRAGMLGATLADGAIGGLAAELPAIFNKPGYENEQALWAAVTGAGSYAALNRTWAKAAPHVAEDVERFIGKTTQMRNELESETALGSGSVGAAQVAGYIEPVKNGLDSFLKLTTEETALTGARFDYAKLKNSKNPLVAAVADRMGLDTVGNKNKDAAITRPIEFDKRIMEERANIAWARDYTAAAERYRTRNKIGWWEWTAGGAEDRFQREITAAHRNTDPVVHHDPDAEKLANTWRTIAQSWKENALNPGKNRGETLKSLPGAESWPEAKDYLPRYVSWNRWRQLNTEFGTLELKKLIGRSIAAKNPDMEPDLALKLGGWYYDRIRNVEAGQEIAGQRVFSGADTEAMRKSLTEELGLSEDEVNRVLYQATERENAGKTMTSRQKMRTHMDESFSLPLSGKNGTREVSIHEIWEDNMRSIVHAYNNQMAGAVALAQFRIKNPDYIPDKVVKGELVKGTPEYLVDGIHSDGDWEKLKGNIRAVDDRVRYDDGRQTVEAELRHLQWMMDALTGKPFAIDQTRIGQVLRIAQKLNFVRLMSQAGFASIAELGMITGQTGWKHATRAIPHLEDFKRDIRTGKLKRDELEDHEYVFAVGTDHLRGTGMTLQSPHQTTSMIDPERSSGLDKAEKVLSKAARYTSMISLAPVTTIEERVAQRAVLSKFRAAAIGDEALTTQRMRIIGLDADTQESVLENIRAHGSKVWSDDGKREIETLGLGKWDEKTRSAFEFAVSTWVRRIIQQNDLGQMNAVLGHPLAKLLFQFRSFTIGAWSKNTLSNVHMRDLEALNSFWAAMVFGGVAYSTQTALNGIGLGTKEADAYYKTRLSNEKIAAAAFQRAGMASLMPGVMDLGLGFAGLDPVFDTRSTMQPTQGWAANPTTGLIDSIYQGIRGVTQSASGDPFTSKDFRNLSRAVNVLHSYPLMIQTINATSSGLSPD